MQKGLSVENLPHVKLQKPNICRFCFYKGSISVKYLQLLNKKNNLQRQLNLYVDDKGLLRCKGRLQNADLSEDLRFPIHLSKGDKFTQLLVEKCHKELLESFTC